MVAYVGEVHSSALAAYGADDIGTIRGSYEGQAADLHPKSKSMLEAAYEMDDCPTETRISRDKLTKRDIKDKKKSNAKKKILANYVSRLDKYQGGDKYTEHERKFNRLKQQVMLQNRHGMWNEDGAAELTYDGETLSEYLLRQLSLEFDEPTEQDNVLAYLQEIEEFESASNQEEIAQCDKMLRRLEGKSDEKSQERISDFQSKKETLEEQIVFSKKFSRSLELAQQKLQKIHGQEIADGYNLIPKASDLMKGRMTIGGRDLSATDVAAIYRDNILCCDDFFSVFSVIISICTASSSDRLNTA